MSKITISPDQSLALAKKYSKAGDLAQACEIYQQILRQLPQHKKAKKELKRLQSDLKRRGGSVPVQQRLSELVSLYNNKQLDEALSKAATISKQVPDQPLPFNITGVILAGRGQYQEAIKNYRKALAIEPSYPDVHNNLGAACNALGKPEEAIGHFRQAIALQPRDSEAHFNLASTLRNTGQAVAAAEAYEQATLLQPSFAKAHLELGNTLNQLRKPQLAAIALENCLQLEPENARALEFLGDAQAKLGTQTAAQASYRQALALEPENWELYKKLGVAQLLDGDSEAALESLHKSLELNADNPQVEHFIAVATRDASGTAPSGYVAGLFDQYAADFDEHLVKTLEYSTPDLLKALLQKTAQANQRFSNAVDLGCGTGLSGSAFRDITDTLAGIDLSPEMLARAREKGIYDNLYHGEVIAVLEQLNAQYDLIVCADMLVYVGNLQPLMHTLGKYARPGCVFLFSTEHLPEGSVELRRSGRYAHSPAYVRQSVEAAGFELLGDELMNLRKDEGAWITGGCFLARFGGA